jgi:2-oxoglutarate dehydrogenase E1 component
LPHGFEGSGPEHSSARLERFLLLAADDNIQVVYPTTPAQMFHVLRRQVLRPWRKPLIVMTPKSLLRHPRMTSSFDDLASGRFQRIINDDGHVSANRILLCSGKIYYELERERERLNREDVAIVRLEQLYPLQEDHLQAALDRYPRNAGAVWVQEEPENMGAWRYLRSRFGNQLLGRPFGVVTRPASASPATGSSGAHKKEQEKLITEAFELHD